MIKRIAFTMYVVTDMDRARKFYEGQLGLVKSSSYQGDKWIEYDPGGCFAITNMVPGLKPSNDSGGIAFEVDDAKALTEKLRASGVTVKVDTFETPVCFMSVVLDPDGNKITLHQLKRPS